MKPYRDQAIILAERCSVMPLKCVCLHCVSKSKEPTTLQALTIVDLNMHFMEIARHKERSMDTYLFQTSNKLFTHGT
jgi:hypothetical protein